MKKSISWFFARYGEIFGLTKAPLVVSLFAAMLVAGFEYSFAQEEGGGGISSILQFQNIEPAAVTIDAGGIVTLKGSVANLVARDMVVSVSLKSTVWKVTTGLWFRGRLWKVLLI
ncbi:hypothetical protein [Nitrososphaera viennensis]|uniref:Uncharacterized protein n=2 Tax=Nitrososphaera viennensis TaxID=1034015 RepID=A0A060HP93_9ARCH|nr:hypothetical protein [Nitrososphaera viennensis]AIC16925.1 exported protein of unknown function [Nitrososphaera viennensis EN76]UVS68830.1 hypothetical protein NWT39_13095 [Nitrososphaera viennensis]